MHIQLSFHLVAAALLTATTLVEGRLGARRLPRQSRPRVYGRQLEPIEGCTFLWPANEGDTCASMAAEWGITLAQFIEYNPSVGANCANQVVPGTEYCLEVNNGQPTATATPTTTTEPTTTPKPSPTQDGITEQCNSFYKVVAGDSCTGIVSKNGITLDQFVAWNTALAPANECNSKLWAQYYVCVGIPGITTAPPASTTTTAPSGPSPTQDGIISSCTKYHQAVVGDTCPKIIAKYGNTFTQAELIAWNPALQSDCSGIWATYYYCVAIPGTPTTSIPASTTTAPTGPSPTQDGIISNCTKYHQAVSGDTCSKIIDKYRTFTLSEFISWNPALNADCSGLWLTYHYCIAIPGTPTTPPTSTTTTTTPTGPSPTQEGIISTCTKYYQAVAGDTCDLIASKHRTFTSATFISWNPVGANCQSLWVGYWYCIAVPGTPTTPLPSSTPKPTTTTTTNNAPTPTHSPIATNCNKYYQVKSGDTCEKIQTGQGVSKANLYKWNAFINAACSNIWVGYYICVGVRA